MIQLANKRILVTGGGGLIGRHLIDNLKTKRNVSEENIFVPDSQKDDLRVLANSYRVMKDSGAEIVIHLAAKTGGVRYSSMFPVDQYYNNALMDLQVVEAARLAGVEKVVLVSSSCAYPLVVPSFPMIEEYLWLGKPQETNIAYGVVKRNLEIQAGAYRQQYGMNVVVVVPNNAYGPGDNFHPEHSHVIPSLIRRCIAKEDPFVVWGDGTPTRDFLYVKDFAEGVILAAEKLEVSTPVNLGSGVETRVSDLVRIVQELTGHTGQIIYDTSKPNGQPRRSVSIEKAKNLLGFAPHYSLRQGLEETINWYKEELSRT